ncbi:hypothetical protein [Micromonospora sp. NPDC047074]|uniref:hypothetical protein n=1 Tax=Micromonospora sp. NPDC047074 TaxID=3154339 RepID=UPI003406B25E
MATFSLIDIVSPYVLGGAAIGEPFHELLTVLFVTEVETAFDDNGVVISGIARFSADVATNPPVYTPPASITWQGALAVDHDTVRSPGAYWDFADIAITFRLSVPRQSSPAADAVLAGGLGNAGVQNLLTGLGQGQPAPGVPAADAPGTVFHLDLLLDAATLHLPFLTGARLLPDGRLAPDPVTPEVTVTLPKIKLSFAQTAGGPATDPQFTIGLDSWAAHDIDDPAGAGYGELLRMNPPYALLGPADWFGFGFASVVLDLSGTSTPPELIAKFGVGEDFRGIYLPDVRVFLQPGGATGLAFDVSARELLIGIGPEGGVSGIFGLDIVKPDSPQAGTVTIYDEFGMLIRRIDIHESPGPGPAPALVVDPTPVPAKTTWVVDVTGGQPPYNINVDGQVQTTAAVTVTIPPGATAKTVEVVITDVHTTQQRRASFPLTLTAGSLTAPQGSVPGAPQAATITPLGPVPAGHSITIEDNPGAGQVTIVVTPEGTAPPPTVALSPGGVVTLVDGRAVVPLAHGAQVDVTATWNHGATGATTQSFDAQFQYDQPLRDKNNPDANEYDLRWSAFASDPSNIRTIRSKDAPDPYGGWEGEDNYLVNSPAFIAFVDAAKQNPAATITLTGSASREGSPNAQYNVELSWRRLWVIKALLRSAGFGVTNTVNTVAAGETGPGYGQPQRSEYRRVQAELTVPGTAASTKTVGVRIARPPRPSTPVPVVPPVVERKAVGSDDARFKELHIRVQIDHNRLIAAEAELKIDVQTVLESYLTKVKTQNPGQVPGSASPLLPVGKQADPDDGLLAMRFQLTLDDTVGRWQLLLSLFENDKDGFLQTPPPTAPTPPPDNFLRDFFGLMIALAPLVDASANAGTTEGAVIGLALGAGLPLAAAALGVVHVPRITLYGGELKVDDDPTGTSAALLMDVEVAIIVALPPIIDTDPKNPITVRYKAVGFALSKQPGLRDLLPVFDSSKGYTINVPSSGGIRVPDPLGDIIQVAGTRIARSNPVNIELDLELKADLGVVTVDKTTVRIPLDGSSAPTISALGVHIDVDGAIEGSGYLAIFDDGFAGQLDVSLPGLGIRVAAGLSVRHVPSAPVPPGAKEATAILLTLEVDFPVPIALGSSGLGIYGFGGLFALHHKRNENDNDPVPALDWLTRVNGNPMDITGWVPDIDHWAIGLGALLGTMDAGFTLNVKGMLIFEMPGPRILLVMKAKLIWVRPPRKGNPTATILAVIDIDLGRGRITIGLTFDYEIRPLLAIHLPVRAIFPFNDLPHFAIDVGTWWNPGTVTFFEIFKARGYFMIRGRGIPDLGPGGYDASANTPFPLPALGGFSIATGVSVSYIWGNRSSGLYISVGSSFDMGIGFAPIFFAGKLRLWGELHLWVIGIEASAQLTIQAGQVPDGPPIPDPEYPGDPTKTVQPTKNMVLIDGEVRGEIDLFFFTISGSVHVTLGASPGSPPAPPPLVTGVSLQSRAAALLQGVNSDRPIDGKLADAHADSAAIPSAEAVPIDSIIVIHFDCTPRVAGATTTFPMPGGPHPEAIAALPGPSAPAVRRGEPYYTYRITSITVAGPDLTEGATPTVWWPNVPNPGAESKREFALLTRVPDAHPSAVERSRHAEHLLEQHWASICDPVAPATRVLWTFHDAPLGPSSIGWLLTGIAWPDPPGSTRDSTPNLRLDVAEVWRSGSLLADSLVDVAPARVIGSLVACGEGCGQTPQREAPGRAGVADTGERLPLTVVGAGPIANAVPRASRAEQLGSLGLGLVQGRTTTATATSSRAVARGCSARALEAPFLRSADPKVLTGQHPLGDLLTDLLTQALAQGRPALDDVVALRTREIVATRMLLWVPRVALGVGALVLRFFAADGTVLDEVVLDGTGPSIQVSSRNDLPRDWIDPEGPWHCRVDEVWTLFESMVRTERGIVLLVDTAVPQGTSYLQLGLREVAGLLVGGLTRPSYLVGIVDTLTAAEVRREEMATKVKQDTVTVVNGALEEMPDPPALLRPNSEYAVTVAWEYALTDADGTPKAPQTWTAGTAQKFRFRTDGEPLKPREIAPADGPAVPMPVRLDPWILTSDPDEGDRFRFHAASIKIAFSVDYLLTMFEAYGRELKVQVRAASFKNSTGTPTYPLTVADLVTKGPQANVRPLQGTAVLTPWEGMMTDLLADKPCVDSSGSKVRHQILDVNLLLQPRTDYILDIEVKDAPPPVPGTLARPLFRRNFSTSRYADEAQMCADVVSSRVTESPADAVAIAGLVALAAPGALNPAALDSALRAAGLRPVVNVEGPEVEVLWTAIGGVQQPRVLVIRTPEPLLRTRAQPENYSPPGNDRLYREVIRMAPKPYLDIVATPGAAGAAAIAVVGQPGMSTILVLVEDGRGKPISLSLRRFSAAILGESNTTTDHALLSLNFDGPSWELV